MLQKFQIQEGRVVAASDDSAPIWVCYSPDETERKYLVEHFKVDEHTLNSALDPDEVSRLEFEPEHLAIVFKRPKTYRAEDNLVFKVLSTGLFLFKDRLIVVMSDDIPLFEGKPLSPNAGPADVMLRLLSSTIAHFLGHLKTITMISDEVEQKINRSMENRHLYSLFTLEKSLVYYLNALNANAVVVDKLRNNAARAGFTPEHGEFLEDLSIETQQCYRQAEIYSNILSSLMDARASIVNNNLNQLIKTLTIITLGIMLPTLVVSIFSMNVSIPLSGHPYGFWIILGMAAASMAGMFFVGRWRKW
jgi:magnesium transporter